jgi:hypothetical protein
MARLPRVLYKLFGATGPTDDFAEFGSQTAGSPVKTKNIATIQALAAWDAGLKSAIIAANRAPFLEDVNAIEYVHGYMLAYLLQEGIGEWDGNTTYHANSIVKKPGTYELYVSLVNDNTGNALPVQTDDTNWKFVFPVRTTQLIGTIADAQIAAVAVNKIIGQVLDAQIVGLSASKIAGLIQGSQIQDVPISKVVGSVIGAYVAKSFNTNYLADTGGMVCGYCTTISSGNAGMTGYCDTSNPPTTIRIRSAAPTLDGFHLPISMPVPKGYYWRVTAERGTSLWFIPFGN